ncbi:MAG: hypothetical protein ACQESG_01040 [Nanobdellota archaeon]
MGFPLNAKANVHVHTILYMTGILLIVISVFWFFMNNPFDHLSLMDTIDHDLIGISNMANIACNSHMYNMSYNPLLNTGEVEFTNDVLCIRSSGEGKTDELERCTKLLCPLYENRKFNLSLYSIITIEDMP